MSIAQRKFVGFYKFVTAEGIDTFCLLRRNGLGSSSKVNVLKQFVNPGDESEYLFSMIEDSVYADKVDELSVDLQEDIETLFDNAIAYVNDNDGVRVSLKFGIYIDTKLNKVLLSSTTRVGSQKYKALIEVGQLAGTGPAPEPEEPEEPSAFNGSQWDVYSSDGKGYILIHALPDNNGSPIETIHLYVSDDDGEVLDMNLSLDDDIVVGNGWEIPSLVADTEYSIAINAVNGVGGGAGSVKNLTIPA